MNIKKIEISRQRRALRVRKALRKNFERPRVSVFRSLQHIYAQIIDDTKQCTIVASSSRTLDITDAKFDKKAVARMVGLDLAKKAIQANVQKACFDRGSYLYHGRIKALADGLREGGLQI